MLPGTHISENLTYKKSVSPIKIIKVLEKYLTDKNYYDTMQLSNIIVCLLPTRGAHYEKVHEY